MIPVFLFIFLTLFTSSTLAFLQKDIYPKSNFSIQDSQNESEHYQEACTLIMYGWDRFLTDDEQENFHYMFATWQNQSPKAHFMDYFDNDQGIISKLFLDGSSFSNWRFSLTFYDGKYIDKKFVRVETASINIPLDITINQQNGTFTTKQDFILNLVYGENKNNEYSQQTKGQLTIYFKDKETLEPFTNIDPDDQDVSKYSVQLEFMASDQPFSFTTSLFSSIWHVSTFDIIFACILTGIYILVSGCSFYTESLDEKVSILSVILGYISSSFRFFWALSQIYRKTLLVFGFQGIILAGLWVDYLKHSYFLHKKDPSITICFNFLFAVIFITIGLVEVSFPLFTSFLTCLTLIPPLIIKIKQNSEFEDYFTSFEISQWICSCLWIGYIYLYPGNCYLFSPRPVLVVLFWIIVFLQFVVSLIQERCPIRRARETLLRNRYDEVEYTERIRNILLTQQCAICLDDLISEQQQQRLYKTPCNHFFHKECLREWAAHAPLLTCPDCRRKLPRLRD